MSRLVHVTAPSRLHFGLWSLAAARGRQFGGVGAMIDKPGLRLTIEPGAGLEGAKSGITLVVVLVSGTGVPPGVEVVGIGTADVPVPGATLVRASSNFICGVVGTIPGGRPAGGRFVFTPRCGNFSFSSSARIPASEPMEAYGSVRARSS